MQCGSASCTRKINTLMLLDAARRGGAGGTILASGSTGYPASMCGAGVTLGVNAVRLYSRQGWGAAVSLHFYLSFPRDGGVLQ